MDSNYGKAVHIYQSTCISSVNQDDAVKNFHRSFYNGVAYKFQRSSKDSVTVNWINIFATP